MLRGSHQLDKDHLNLNGRDRRGVYRTFIDIWSASITGMFLLVLMNPSRCTSAIKKHLCADKVGLAKKRYLDFTDGQVFATCCSYKIYRGDRYHSTWVFIGRGKRPADSTISATNSSCR